MTEHIDAKRDMISVTVRAEVPQISFSLPDGRHVTVFRDGDVHVAEREGYSNRYQFSLPTFEEIATGCDGTDDNEISFSVHHRH